ncbi:MAG: extracellular solute-binding protein [Lachnospiraceae bacterium]|nr:extracellular solute-binding protein [Lachnospiraceae bacterium]MBR6271319.1 extracellular solute-binding protein [Lachnospiraceae bacterium]
MKKFLVCLLSVIMVFSLVACGGEEQNGSGSAQQTQEGGKPAQQGGATGNELAGVQLEVAVNYTGDSLTAFQQICSNFESKYGATIVIDNYGSDYSSTMINRMAANNLPDVFVTAGWSLRRYKSVSLDLSDQEYCKDYDESALGVIQDDDGKIYVNMISNGVNGNVVNLAVCEAAGVDPFAITTWDEFLDACAKIKAAGFTPIASNPDAGLTANLAGTFLTYEGEVADVGEQLKNGTWDWAEYIYLLKFYQKALMSEYFFKDARSINTNDMYERMAAGQAAFIISENTASIATLYSLNPKGNFTFAPFPASKAGGEEAVVSGEGDAFSIWKDSGNIEAAKIFLNFLATPEITLKLLDATSRVSCQKTVMAIDETPGTKALAAMKEKYAGHNIGYHNVWDREYLPSGMWAYMGTAANKLFADYTDSGLNKVIEFLKDGYDNVYTGE